MKTCRKCNQQKPLESFCRVPACRDGREGTCKACKYIAHKVWVAAHPEKPKEYQANWRKANPYWKGTPSRWAKNADKYNARRRAWRAAHPEEYREQARKWKVDRERVRVRYKLWKAENKDRINQNRREFLARNPNAKMAARLRDRLHKCLKAANAKKSVRTSVLLGCSFDFFREYIAARFKGGMTWENWGSVWHLDHIRPVCSFDLVQIEEQRRCFHYTNLQPLFAAANLKKGSRLSSHQPSFL